MSDDDRHGPQPLGEAYCHKETPGAILVQLIDDGEDRFWVPKSCLHDDSECWGEAPDRREGQLVVKFWWAEKEGYV